MASKTKDEIKLHSAQVRAAILATLSKEPITPSQIVVAPAVAELALTRKGVDYWLRILTASKEIKSIGRGKWIIAPIKGSAENRQHGTTVEMKQRAQEIMDTICNVLAEGKMHRTQILEHDSIKKYDIDENKMSSYLFQLREKHRVALIGKSMWKISNGSAAESSDVGISLSFTLHIAGKSIPMTYDDAVELKKKLDAIVRTGL